MQSILLDSLYGTERGLNASSEVRSEISELITQLEAQNPTPAPTEVLTHVHFWHTASGQPPFPGAKPGQRRGIMSTLR